MKKLNLDLNHLVVDSFDTSAPVRVHGTVFGEQCTCETNCTCPGCPTCDASCDTCDMSCGCPTEGWYSCGVNCNTNDDPTCDPTNLQPAECCPG